MTRLSVRLVVAAVLTAAPSASAIDLGFGLLKRKPTPPATVQPAKPDPALRLKQLLATLQSDPDIDRRKAAAEELKAADPRAVADLLPALVGAVQKDPSPAVRTVAVEALGAMKTPTPAAGAALETAEKGDPDAGVRAAARAALWQHQVNASKTAGGPVTGQTGEPPFARPPLPSKSPTAAEPTFRPITQGPGKGGVFKETAEPPFAKPTPLPAPLAKPGELPPLSIPALPPTIVAPPPGSDGLPTIVPPGGGR